MLRTRSRGKEDSLLNMAPTLYALKSPTSSGQGQVVVVYNQEIPQEVRNHRDAWRCCFQLTEAEAQEVKAKRCDIKSTETYSRALQWSQPQGQAPGRATGSGTTGRQNPKTYAAGWALKEGERKKKTTASKQHKEQDVPGFCYVIQNFGGGIYTEDPPTKRIYLDWATVQQLIHGVSGPVFRRVNTAKNVTCWELAVKFLKDSNTEINWDDEDDIPPNQKKRLIEQFDTTHALADMQYHTGEGMTTDDAPLGLDTAEATGGVEDAETREGHPKQTEAPTAELCACGECQQMVSLLPEDELDMILCENGEKVMKLTCADRLFNSNVKRKSVQCSCDDNTCFFLRSVWTNTKQQKALAVANEQMQEQTIQLQKQMQEQTSKLQKQVNDLDRKASVLPQVYDIAVEKVTVVRVQGLVCRDEPNNAVDTAKRISTELYGPKFESTPPTAVWFGPGGESDTTPFRHRPLFVAYNNPEFATSFIASHAAGMGVQGTPPAMMTTGKDNTPVFKPLSLAIEDDPEIFKSAPQIIIKKDDKDFELKMEHDEVGQCYSKDLTLIRFGGYAERFADPKYSPPVPKKKEHHNLVSPISGRRSRSSSPATEKKKARGFGEAGAAATSPRGRPPPHAYQRPAGGRARWSPPSHLQSAMRSLSTQIHEFLLALMVQLFDRDKKREQSSYNDTPTAAALLPTAESTMIKLEITNADALPASLLPSEDSCDMTGTQAHMRRMLTPNFEPGAPGSPTTRTERPYPDPSVFESKFCHSPTISRPPRTKRKRPKYWWNRSAHPHFIATWILVMILSTLIFPARATPGHNPTRPNQRGEHLRSLLGRPQHPNNTSSLLGKPNKKKSKGIRKKEQRNQKKQRMNPMRQVHVVSWNVRGLNKENKTWDIFDLLEQFCPKAHIVFLSETWLLQHHINPALTTNHNWDAHRLDATSPKGKGGAVLLTRKNKFQVKLIATYQANKVDAASWQITNASWKLPLLVSGIYRNHPTPVPGATTADIENLQMEAIQAMAELTAKHSGPSIMAGDFNFSLGSLQERLVHPELAEWALRKSVHRPVGGPSRLAKAFLNIVDQNQLLIMNGRFGEESARCTFHRGPDTATCIDYALCKQEQATQVKHMKVEDNCGDTVWTDHRPLTITLAMNIRQQSDEPDTGWHAPFQRDLLDISPISTVAWEEDGLRERYHQKLTPHLRQVQDRLQSIGSHSRCQRLTPQQRQLKLDEAYQLLTDGIISAANTCLKTKNPAAGTGAASSRKSTIWKPDKEWRRLKAAEQATYTALQEVDPNNKMQSARCRLEHRLACKSTRTYAAQARHRWLGKKLEKISLFGSPHTMMRNWTLLKRSLGEEVTRGLPTTVRTSSGQLLLGQEATDHWHKAREAISSVDPLAPSDPKAVNWLKLRMQEISRQEQSPAPTSSRPQPPMNQNISLKEVKDALAHASTGTAPGLDTVHNELLKEGGEHLCQTLHTLFNMVWTLETIPSAWRKALIRPIYKAKSACPLTTENYRAVTLINTMCKLYEDVLCQRIGFHLESTHQLSGSQAGSRRLMGCTEMVYTLAEAIKHRHETTGQGTYACFVDFQLAYPSCHHDIILQKLHAKGVQGPIWRNIRALYTKMQSQVMHPAIAKDDFFDINIGLREGSILSPILFLVVADDMQAYLQKHPFEGGSAKNAQPQVSHLGKRPPRNDRVGLHINGINLSIFQYVDDACLLAESPEELQHMINVLAQYCLENQLTLNPKEGKTEVVEFMCAPSGRAYTVPAPTSPTGCRRDAAHLHVKQGYQYLGFWLDSGLTFDEQATRVANRLVGGGARAAAMGARPGGLPIRSRFQLWSALALPYLHSSAALLSNDHIQLLQRRMDNAVRSMVGSLVEPAAVLSDLGLPDANTIKLVRTANLRVRLQTLPKNLLPAAFHRFLETQRPQPSRLVRQMQDTFHTLNLEQAWRSLPSPPSSLARYAIEGPDPIKTTRRSMETKIRKAAWEHHRQLLLHNKVPYNKPRMKEFVILANEDLRRARLNECASFLQMNLTPKQEAALVNMRAGGSLLSANIHHNEREPDLRCDGCMLRNHHRHLSDDDLVENLEHALFRCCKPPSQRDRTVWLNGMRDALARALSSAQRKDPRGRRLNLEWASLPKPVRLSLAVGSPPPAHWILLSDGTNSNRKALADLHGELVAHTAPYIADIDMGLRKYCRRWLQSVDEDDTIEWKALHELWEDLPDFDSDDSDGRSDDESDDDDT